MRGVQGDIPMVGVRGQEPLESKCPTNDQRKRQLRRETSSHRKPAKEASYAT